MSIEQTVKKLTGIVHNYLPHTNALDLIHDRAHQEMLRLMMSKVDEVLHGESPEILHGIMEHCVGKDMELDKEVGMVVASQAKSDS